MTTVNPKGFIARRDRLVRSLLTKVHVGIAFARGDNPPALTEYTAIWDTGATGSVTSKNVVSDLSLKPISVTKVSTVGGVITSPVYLISVLLPNNVGFPSLRVTLGNFTGGDGTRGFLCNKF